MSSVQKSKEKKDKKRVNAELIAARNNLITGRNRVDFLTQLVMNHKVMILQYLACLLHPSQANKIGFPDWMTAQKTTVLHFCTVGTLRSDASGRLGLYMVPQFDGMIGMYYGTTTWGTSNGTPGSVTQFYEPSWIVQLLSVANFGRFVAMDCTLKNLQPLLTAVGQVASACTVKGIDGPAVNSNFTATSLLQGAAVDTASNILEKTGYHDYWCPAQVGGTFVTGGTTTALGTAYSPQSFFNMGSLIASTYSSVYPVLQLAGEGFPANTDVLQITVNAVVEVIPLNQILGGAAEPGLSPPPQAASAMVDITLPEIRENHAGIIPVSDSGVHGHETPYDVLLELLNPKLLSKLSPDLVSAVDELASSHPSIGQEVTKAAKKYGPELLDLGLSALPVPGAGIVGKGAKMLLNSFL